MDPSKIADRTGNPLKPPLDRGYLHPFWYFDPAMKQATQRSGGGLQMVVITGFLGQLLLFCLLKSTMAHLWDMVHQMQFVSYLLLMDIRFPPVVPTFVSYFEVANGKLDAISGILPKFPEVIIDPDDLRSDTLLLQDSFKEADIFSIYTLALKQRINECKLQ